MFKQTVYCLIIAAVASTTTGCDNSLASWMVSPRGGETFRIGGSTFVGWQCVYGYDLDCNGKATAFVEPAAGGSRELIGTASATNGGLTWRIEQKFQPGFYRIIVEGVTGFDDSFSLTSPEFQLVRQ